jgi:hypothetical protein
MCTEGIDRMSQWMSHYRHIPATSQYEAPHAVVQHYAHCGRLRIAGLRDRSFGGFHKIVGRNEPSGNLFQPSGQLP